MLSHIAVTKLRPTWNIILQQIRIHYLKIYVYTNIYKFKDKNLNATTIDESKRKTYSFLS